MSKFNVLFVNPLNHRETKNYTVACAEQDVMQQARARLRQDNPAQAAIWVVQQINRDLTTIDELTHGLVLRIMTDDLGIRPL